MDGIKLNWIECKLTTCRECKHKCKEYIDANRDSNYFEGYKPNYYFDTNKKK